MQIQPMENLFNAQALQNFPQLPLKFGTVSIKDYGRVWSSQFKDFVSFDPSKYIFDGSSFPPSLGVKVFCLQEYSIEFGAHFVVPAQYDVFGQGTTFIAGSGGPYQSVQSGSLTYFVPFGTTVDTFSFSPVGQPRMFFFWFDGTYGWFFPYSTSWYYGRLNCPQYDDKDTGFVPLNAWILNMAPDGTTVWNMINPYEATEYFFNMIALGVGYTPNDLTDQQQLAGYHFFGKLIIPDMSGACQPTPYLTHA